MGGSTVRTGQAPPLCAASGATVKSDVRQPAGPGTLLHGRRPPRSPRLLLPVLHRTARVLRQECAESFDRVVVIDVHEHLADVLPFNREIERVLEPGGVAIVTTPNGDRGLPVARLKRVVGMEPEEYGHTIQGYETAELEAMMRQVGLQPEGTGAYARFFTELIELVINFGYVKVLARRGRGPE